jgi:hypothetical protein
MRLKPLIRGVLTYVPALDRVMTKPTGGTDSPRYCYSVWLRHLVMAHNQGLNTQPRVVAELGPGDSLGLGLAALLTGSEKYFAFDIVTYADLSRNLRVLDELVDLFRERAPIPGVDEFPKTKPYLDSYEFPNAILTEERLVRCLSDERVAAIRTALENVGGESHEKEGIEIRYVVPWHDRSVIRPDSVDMVYSQAVLEHVDDLTETYEALAAWLKPGGYASHQIGFVCHGITREWNGHWAISPALWRMTRGRRDYLLNREPATTHIRLIRALGLEVVNEVKVHAESEITPDRLARPFKDMSQEDLTTLALFVQATKPNPNKPGENV